MTDTQNLSAESAQCIAYKKTEEKLEYNYTPKKNAKIFAKFCGHRC